MAWLYYLIEANVYLSVFFALYHFFLKKETRYVLNRWYLLTTSVIAFLLPFLSVSYLKDNVVSISTGFTERPLYEIPSVITGTSGAQLPTQPQNDLNLGFDKLLFFFYVIVVCIFLFNLSVNLYKIITIYNAADKKRAYHITYVNLLDKKTEIFSFFNWLFLHPNMYANKAIMEHEKTHIKQGHSYDVLFFELLRSFNWFNPFIYRLAKDVKLNHEFIADQEATKILSSKYDYANLLIQYAYVPKERLSHSAFTESQLEQRIEQLGRNPSKKSSIINYLTVFPLVSLLFFIAAFKVEKSYGIVHIIIDRNSPQTRSEKVGLISISNQVKAEVPSKEVSKPIYKKSIDSVKNNSIPMVNQLTSELIKGPRLLDQLAEELAKEGKKLYGRDYMLHWTINHSKTPIRKVTHGVLSGTEAQLFRGELADTLYIDEGFYKIKNNVVNVSTDNLMISYADGIQTSQKKLIVIDALKREIIHSLANVDIITKGTIYKVEVNPDFGYVNKDKLVDSLKPKYVDMKAANAKFPYIMVSFNSRVREARVTANQIITNETNLPKDDPWQPGIIW